MNLQISKESPPVQQQSFCSRASAVAWWDAYAAGTISNALSDFDMGWL